MAAMLRGVTLLIVIYGDMLKDDAFAKCLGSVSAREVVRQAKDRRTGVTGYADTMLRLYNKKTKPALSLLKLYSYENT
jgi:hypothetical protein